MTDKALADIVVFPGGPVAFLSMTSAEKLAANLDLALAVHAEILGWGIDPDQPARNRLVAAVAAATLQAAIKIDEVQFQRQDYRLRNLDRLIASLEASSRIGQ